MRQGGELGGDGNSAHEVMVAETRGPTDIGQILIGWEVGKQGSWESRVVLGIWTWGW